MSLINFIIVLIIYFFILLLTCHLTANFIVYRKGIKYFFTLKAELNDVIKSETVLERTDKIEDIKYLQYFVNRWSISGRNGKCWWKPVELIIHKRKFLFFKKKEKTIYETKDIINFIISLLNSNISKNKYDNNKFQTAICQ